MKKIQIRKNGTRRVYTENNEPSKTDQQFKEDCDVNTIMDRFLKTGQVSHLAKNQGLYADVSSAPDFQEAMEITSKANQAFEALPARVRERFGNSPIAMLAFLDNPENDKEAIALGLKTQKAGLNQNDSTGTKPKGAVDKPKEPKLKSDKSPKEDS